VSIPLPEPIVATAVLLLLHAPPLTPSLNDNVLPAHMLLPPLITVGAAFTVSAFVD
jgi:hypothetical protein